MMKRKYVLIFLLVVSISGGLAILYSQGAFTAKMAKPIEKKPRDISPKIALKEKLDACQKAIRDQLQDASSRYSKELAAYAEAVAKQYYDKGYYEDALICCGYAIDILKNIGIKNDFHYDIDSLERCYGYAERAAEHIGNTALAAFYNNQRLRITKTPEKLKYKDSFFRKRYHLPFYDSRPQEEPQEKSHGIEEASWEGTEELSPEYIENLEEYMPNYL